MCVASLGVALGAQAGTAASSTLGLTAISTAVGVVSSAVGIVQAQSQAAFAQQQANTQHVNMQLQAQNDRKGQMYDHIARINAANASGLATQKGIYNSQMAANRGMVAKQLERKQAADQAAFQSLDIYRKQIGSRGKILAAGVTGQSVGLMAPSMLNGKVDLLRRSSTHHSEVLTLLWRTLWKLCRSKTHLVKINSLVLRYHLHAHRCLHKCQQVRSLWDSVFLNMTLADGTDLQARRIQRKIYAL